MERAKAWIKANPIPAAIVAAALLAFVVALATGNEWFVLVSRGGLLVAGVIAVVANMRRTARDAQVEDYERPALEREANAAAQRYVIFMVLLVLAASIGAASIYDDFKLIRWLF